MDNDFTNFYNNLVHLTRNKNIYKDFINQDSYSDRLTIFLFHFAFFLNVFKSNSEKKALQDIFDYIFNQLEISIREIGYGDTSINKSMKNYINLFYYILKKIGSWEELNKVEKKQILSDYLNLNNESSYLVEYFDIYRTYLKKNTLNSLLKGVIKLNF